ncbi:MAG: DUF3656 domain-containing protein, partial [Hungatella sp.]
YMGGNRFGARAYADNPDEAKMLEAIDYAHLHGAKLYMTVNTLVKEAELNELFSYLNPYYERGLDAVIVQDMGVFSYIRSHFPDLPIHASTQMTITGVYGAKLLEELGASRIVTARELSLEEIVRIHRESDIEIESFVHGALCYCYSGQCLLSSLIGGRSGNRGRCAQPCRLPYDVKRGNQTLGRKDEKYVLSPKDLCTLDLLPDLLESGIFSLKIEGRMKNPRYTAGVVSIYRKYADAYLKHGRSGYAVDPKDKEMLLDLFDRGGFTDGYYKQHNGAEMIAKTEKPSFRRGNEELFRYLDETYVQSKKQEAIRGQVILKENQPIALTLSCGDVSVEVYGAIPQEAQRQPITEEKLRKQMEKTGNTPFRFEQLEVIIRGEVFLPLQELNEVRRAGLEALEQEILKRYYRKSGNRLSSTQETQMSDHHETGESSLQLHVLLERKEGLAEVLQISEVSEVIIESDAFDPEDWKQVVKLCHQAGKRCVLAMPTIFRTKAETYFDKCREDFLSAGFDLLLIRSLEEIHYVEKMAISLPLIFDHNLYIFNHLSAQMMLARGADRLTLPLELNSRELEELGCRERELIGYGYLPVMVSAQCVRKNMEGCSGKSELLYLKDRMGKDLAVQNHCKFCYNMLYNSTPLSLLGQESLIKRLAPLAVRLQFTRESGAEIGRITQAYAASFIRGEAVESPIAELTRGHFKRGVE